MFKNKMCIAICTLTIITVIMATSVAINDISQMPVIKIKSPEMNSSVPPVPIEINGSIAPDIIPSGWHMWALVCNQITPDQWWPQGGSEISPIHNEWHTEAKIGGGDDDINNWFKIEVVFVNDLDNDRLKTWVTETSLSGTYYSIPMPTSANLSNGDLVKVKRA